MSSNEEQFKIQPHPTVSAVDCALVHLSQSSRSPLNQRVASPGLPPVRQSGFSRCSPHPDAITAEIAAHHANGPHILRDKIKNNIEQPLVIFHLMSLWRT